MWEKFFNEKHITGFLYFQNVVNCFDGPIENDPFRDEQRKLFYPFLAKRLLNDYKGLLNKKKISEKVDIVHPWTFSYASFLYFCGIFDKKEYIKCLETYIDENLKLEGNYED